MGVSKIPNNIAWKYFGELTGAGAITFPNLEYSELYIVVDINNSVNKAIFQFPRAILSNSKSYFMDGGYYDNSNSQMVKIGATLTQVFPSTVSMGGTSYLSTSTMKLFYR